MALALVVILAAGLIFRMSTSAAKGSRSHFIEKIEAGEVSDVKISGDTTEYYVTTEPGAFGAKGNGIRLPFTTIRRIFISKVQPLR